MAEKIYVEPDSIWDYFKSHKEDLETAMDLVAENTDYGVEIYLSSDLHLPQFIVFVDNDEVYEEGSVNEHDCRFTARTIYDDYLTEKIFDLADVKGEPEMEFYDQNRLIEDREEEIDLVIEDLLNVVSGTSESYYEKLDAVKERVLEVLAREFDIKVYRPMFLVDEDGEEFFEDYPYECMIFDDEDDGSGDPQAVAK